MELHDFIPHKQHLEGAIKIFLTQQNYPNLDHFYIIQESLINLIDRARSVMNSLDPYTFECDFLTQVLVKILAYKGTLDERSLMQKPNIRLQTLTEFYEYLIEVDRRATEGSAHPAESTTD